MIIFLCGDSHGELEELYNKILALENQLNVKCDLVLHTGSFGVWPDPNRLDRATRNNKNKIDFYKYYLSDKSVPRPTYFVSGKHEDHNWIKMMAGRGNFEVIPNLFWLVPGKKHIYQKEDEEVSILGLGKVFSPNTYNNKFSKKSISHYTRFDIERCCTQGQVDIFVSHEPAAGVSLNEKMSSSAGINNVCFAVRPRLMVHGAYNHSLIYNNPKTDTLTKSLAFEEVQAVSWKNKRINFL